MRPRWTVASRFRASTRSRRRPAPGQRPPRWRCATSVPLLGAAASCAHRLYALLGLRKERVKRGKLRRGQAAENFAPKRPGGGLDAPEELPARRGGANGVAPPIARNGSALDEALALHAVDQRDGGRRADVQPVGELALREAVRCTGDDEQSLPLH